MGFVGGTLGSMVGWWLGMFVGIGTAALLSIVGTVFGIWAGRWVLQRWLE